MKKSRFEKFSHKKYLDLYLNGTDLLKSFIELELTLKTFFTLNTFNFYCVALHNLIKFFNLLKMFYCFFLERKSSGRAGAQYRN